MQMRAADGSQRTHIPSVFSHAEEKILTSKRAFSPFSRCLLSSKLQPCNTRSLRKPAKTDRLLVTVAAFHPTYAALSIDKQVAFL